MINTRIIEIDPRELKLLKMNARFMRHEEFQRLVANIKQDGQLTSAPFAALDPADGKYEVLSGNHRVQAAISAGLETIPCIITDDEMSEEQRIAIQLSHNAIVGQDDPDVLKKLYDKILDIDLKEYSGLDDKTLGLLDKIPYITYEAGSDVSTGSQGNSGASTETTTGIKVGDVVEFTGTKHFVSSNAINGKSCKPGKAKVTQIANGGKHPYHLVKSTGSTSTVYGWVDAADVKAGASVQKGTSVKVKKGAKTYTGGSLASFVYSNTYTVMQVDGDRAVIGQNGAVTAAVKVSDLIIQ